VSRVTALSALTASIAHEVSQPPSGIVTNANTWLRILDANPPNVEGGARTVDQIFEAFYTTKTNGTGIGLSISRSIIEAHQGRLWATPNEGPGATFSFAIPCALEGLSDTETRVNRSEPARDAA
jgi:C4-dicarboxylate-specific signal transduction histidine kinase